MLTGPRQRRHHVDKVLQVTQRKLTNPANPFRERSIITEVHLYVGASGFIAIGRLRLIARMCPSAATRKPGGAISPRRSANTAASRSGVIS